MRSAHPQLPHPVDEVNHETFEKLSSVVGEIYESIGIEDGLYYAQSEDGDGMDITVSRRVDSAGDEVLTVCTSVGRQMTQVEVRENGYYVAVKKPVAIRTEWESGEHVDDAAQSLPNSELQILFESLARRAEQNSFEKRKHDISIRSLS